MYLPVNKYFNHNIAVKRFVGHFPPTVTLNVYAMMKPTRKRHAGWKTQFLGPVTIWSLFKKKGLRNESQPLFYLSGKPV